MEAVGIMFLAVDHSLRDACKCCDMFLDGAVLRLHIALELGFLLKCTVKAHGSDLDDLFP